MKSPLRLTRLGLRSDTDIPHIRQVGKVTAQTLGFTAFQQTRIVTAIIEVARNAIVHGGGGHVVMKLATQAGSVVLDIAVSDQGGGMPAVRKADVMADRARRSDRGLGLGLRGAKRIADRFEIETGAYGTDVHLGFVSPAKADNISALANRVSDEIAGLAAVDPATTLAQQNNELMAALAERDLLIKEIHHRTRNNIALIRSMVRLSENAAKHSETKTALAELGNRMQAILSVHELLERSDGSELVEILPFLKSVADRTYDAFSTQDCLITIDVTGASLKIGSNTAVDVGLIVAELMTNALKHAFVGRTTGRVTLHVVEDESHRDAGTFLLEVSDDGHGLPAGQEQPERSASLGWRMIRAMTRRHGGQIVTTNDNGLKVSISLRTDV